MGLAPGSRLGPYEITAQIGAGGMGEVYRARDTRLNRDVALGTPAARMTWRRMVSDSSSTWSNRRHCRRPSRLSRIGWQLCGGRMRADLKRPMVRTRGCAVTTGDCEW